MIKNTPCSPVCQSPLSPTTPAPLLYLYSNNSTESDKKALECVEAVCSTLSPYWKKSAHNLYSNVSRLISLAPAESFVGFLTLTFSDNVISSVEAQARFNSFNSHFLKKYSHVKDWISVKERQGRGSWHFHLLIVLDVDIQSGLNFEEIKNGVYSSANNDLRGIWRDLREACATYNFGRSELLPIKSNQEAMSRYLGKYISKHLENRENQDKGVRLVNYSQGWIKNSIRFSWFTENSMEWRRKLALFAEYNGCTELYQLSDKLGSGWAYRFIEDIFKIDDIVLQSENIPIPHVSNVVKAAKKNLVRFRKSLNFVRRSIKPKNFEAKQILAEIISNFDLSLLPSLPDQENFDNFILQEFYEKIDLEMKKNPLKDFIFSGQKSSFSIF